MSELPCTPLIGRTWMFELPCTPLIGCTWSVWVDMYTLLYMDCLSWTLPLHAWVYGLPCSTLIWVALFYCLFYSHWGIGLFCRSLLQKRPIILRSLPLSLGENKASCLVLLLSLSGVTTKTTYVQQNRVYTDCLSWRVNLLHRGQ